MEPIVWPHEAKLTTEWLQNFTKALDYSSRNLPPSSLPEILTPETVHELLMAAYKVLHKEKNIAEIRPQDVENSTVTLVGDLHGQFHDVLTLFDRAGHPGENSFFVFNGDYVDRGAWGMETYVLLLAWKVLWPSRVILLRGNHETKFCSSAYGFEREVAVKYGPHSKHLFRRILACFESHPLAALVGPHVYVCHGGLFRELELPQHRKSGKGKGSGSSRKSGNRSQKSDKMAPTLKVGSLADLARARRGVLDPSGTGPNVIPGDVLWSDPGTKPGLSYNHTRGIGLLFGPDCTQEFMEKNNLKLIVRSHEGPDARIKRPEMAAMNEGFTIDHDVAAGKLITLFSAPDYPQFQSTKERFENKAAFIVLKHPDFLAPEFHSFEAALPRPNVEAYYDFANALDSDDELDLPEDLN